MRQKAQITQKIKKYTIWIGVIVVVVGLIYRGVSIVEEANKSRPGEAIPIVSRNHVNIGDAHEPYNSNPPTSGPHAGPAPWGVSEKELIDEDVIHNLEHGGIWISYKNLNQEDIKKLEDIGRKYSSRTVVSPRPANDDNIAVASWGRLLKLEEVDVEQITEYVKRNFNKSPEQLAR